MFSLTLAIKVLRYLQYAMGICYHSGFLDFSTIDKTHFLQHTLFELARSNLLGPWEVIQIPYIINT